MILITLLVHFIWVAALSQNTHDILDFEL